MEYYKIFQTIKQSSINIIDDIFPFTCYSCNKILSSKGLCSDCWKDLVFIRPPYCDICGEQFYNNKICTQCAIKTPYFDSHRSALRYGKISKSLIFKLKHSNNYNISKFITHMLLPIAIPMLRDIDFIIPVPLYWTRLAYRGFNQSALIAEILYKYTGISYSNNILKKIKSTKSQGLFSKTERKNNILNTFAANKFVKGKNILIIDDVFTTGSTVNECSKCLKESGASLVKVLTFAKTYYK